MGKGKGKIACGVAQGADGGVFELKRCKRYPLFTVRILDMPGYLFNLRRSTECKNGQKYDATNNQPFPAHMHKSKHTAMYNVQ